MCLVEYAMRARPGSEVVDMLTCFHSMAVNGTELAVPASVLEQVGKVLGNAAPILGASVLMAC